MSRFQERIVTLIPLGFGVAGYISSQNIEGFSLDPLGSKAVPLGLSVLLILGSLVVLLYSFLRPSNSVSRSAHLSDMARVVILFILTAGFAFTVFELRIPLAVATLAFVVLGAICLKISNRRLGLPVAIVSGLSLGFGVELIFTRFFFVDLPTVW